MIMDKLRINLDMVGWYLMQMMGHWLAHNDAMPTDINELRPSLAELEIPLRKHGDEHYFKTAVEYLMKSKEIDDSTWEFLEGAASIPLSIDELKQLLRFIYFQLWHSDLSQMSTDIAIELIRTGPDLPVCGHLLFAAPKISSASRGRKQILRFTQDDRTNVGVLQDIVYLKRGGV